MGTRKSSDNEASTRMKTEFFASFDGVQTESKDRVLVIGATNRPDELDTAAIRYFSDENLIKIWKKSNYERKKCVFFPFQTLYHQDLHTDA